MWQVFRKIFYSKRSGAELGGLNDIVVTTQYPEIKDRWRQIIIQNYNKSLADYPSKHLLGNDEKWGEMLEKQANYSTHLDNVSWEKFKNNYNFSEDEWIKIKMKLISDLMKDEKISEHQHVLIAGNVLLYTKTIKGKNFW